MPYQMPGGDTIAGGGERRGHYALAPAYSPKYENDGLIASTQGRFYVRFQTPEAARRFYEAASEEARPYVSAMIQDQNPLGYVDVFIQSAGLSHTARQSVAEGVSDAFGFYTSGDHPASLSLSMSLLNTRQDQWFDAWALVREALTRPWQLARGNAKLYLQMDTRLYDILPVNESFTYAASQETTVPFSLQALVLGMQVLPMRQAYKHVPTRAQAPPALGAPQEAPAPEPAQSSAPDVVVLRDRGTQLSPEAAQVNQRVLAQQLALQPAATWLV
jgi:hypothetical protein